MGFDNEDPLLVDFYNLIEEAAFLQPLFENILKEEIINVKDFHKRINAFRISKTQRILLEKYLRDKGIIKQHSKKIHITL